MDNVEPDLAFEADDEGEADGQPGSLALPALAGAVGAGAGCCIGGADGAMADVNEQEGALLL